MALTDLAIRSGEGLVSELRNVTNAANDEFVDIIAKLMGDANFEAFCAGTEVGKDLFEKLKTLQQIVSNQIFSGIGNIVGVTSSFLAAQAQLNLNAMKAVGGAISGAFNDAVSGWNGR